MSAGNWPSVRHWTTCTVVVAGHLGVLFLLIQDRSIRGDELPERSLEVVLIPRPEDSQPTAAPARKAIRVRPEHSTHAAAAPSAPLASAPPADVQPPANAITDWAAAAQAGADDFLRQERDKAGRRSFEHEFPVPAPAPKPGVFGSDEENHRAGRVEDGTRFWVSDNCYFDVPRGPPPPPLVGQHQMPLLPTCKPPPTGGGERMFEDLLKKPPAPPPTP
jgi:hypothetical protein